MTPKSVKPDPDQDKRKAAIDKNPCGKCRALGLPMCKGHGSSGGGSGGSSDKDESKAQSASNKPMNLNDSLENSPLWIKSDDMVFEYNMPDALMSVKIDMGQGIISFLSKNNLSPDQQIALQEFFEAIKQEFNEFKEEFSVDASQMQLTQAGNELKITISNPKLFDAFVQRLLDKNILATEVGPTPKKTENTKPQAEQETEYQYKSPIPFDINGPKPKG